MLKVTNNEKENLRKIMLEKRKTIKDREIKEQQITQKLLDFTKMFKSAFVYVSFGFEASTHNFIKSFSGQIVVPITQNGQMEARLLESYKNLQTNKYGNLFKAVLGKEHKCEVAIVPLLAFDSNCYRLGYGGGYYDRYLSNFAGKKIGIAFDEQKCLKVPTESFDIPLDYIITPTKTYKREK